MEYNEAIANLLKFEGSKDAISVIESQVKSLQDSVREYQNLESNVANIIGGIKDSETSLTDQLKEVIKEKNTLANQLQAIELENKSTKQQLNKTLLEKDYNINSKALSKLLDFDKISWKENKAYVGEEAIDKYIENNLSEFKDSIINKREVDKKETDSVQKLSSGNAKGEAKDGVIDYINSLFSPSHYLIRS